MKMRSSCAIVVFMVCTAGLLNPSAGRAESTNHSASANEHAASTGTNLLYIVPKGMIESNGWPSAWLKNRETNAATSDTGAPVTTVYFIPNAQTKANENPFADLFGDDSVIVPVDDSGNLFRLIATRMPKEPSKLPSIRINPRRYHLEAATTEPAWPKGSKPKSIIMRWAEWWQSETNATPVVLVLVHFQP